MPNQIFYIQQILINLLTAEIGSQNLCIFVSIQIYFFNFVID